MYKLSIIIPVFNSEKELKNTLNSIINQTMDFQDIEVIMVNDGSSDNSGKIMDEFSKKYSNFKSIHLDSNNGSPGKPRNIGIKNATADYVMFQDSDDIFTPKACEYLYNTISDEDVDIVGGMLTVKNDAGKDILNFGSWINILDKSSDDFSIKKERVTNLLNSDKLYKFKFNSIYDDVQMLKDSWFTSKIFKKSFLLDNGIKFAEGLNGGEDAVFLLNSLLNANGIIFINKIISNYNTLNSESLSHDKSFKTIQSRVKAYELMLDISRKNDAEEIFVKNSLHFKLEYWITTHLSSSNLSICQIISNLKSAKHLFEKCIEYDVNTKKYLLNLYQLVVDDKILEMIIEFNNRFKFKKYLISIIIPVFNVGNLLNNAMESILNQSIGFENLEVIFVDDCSTDNSLNIIKKFSNKYSNIKYYSTGSNSGFAGKPRNIGVDHANGEYIMFLDPDDVFLEDACSILFENIIREDLDVVSGNFDINRNSEITRNNWNILGLKDNQFKTIRSIDEFYKFLMPPASVWAKIFNTNFILNKNIKFLEGVPAQDLVFVCDSLLKANGIKFINVPIVEYIPREKGDNKSTTAKRNKNVLSGFIKSYTELYYLFLEYNSEYTWLATRNLFFWFKQFNLSKLSIREKVDLLYYAKPLLWDFIESDRLNPPKGLEKFFDYIVEQKFYDAAKLSYHLGINYEDNVNNIVKTKYVIFLCYNMDFNLTNMVKSLFYNANYLDELGYNIILLNMGRIKNFNSIIDKFKKNNYLNESIEFIDIFDYYSDKNSKNNCKDNCIKLDLKSNQFIKKNVNDDDSIVIEYYNQNKNLSENLVKKEMYINDILCYEEIYEDNNLKNQFYYTSDGYEYLLFDSKKIFLSERSLNLKIEFNNMSDFYNYFINEILLDFKEKPFLINVNSDAINYLEWVNDDLALKILNLNETDIVNNQQDLEFKLSNFENILVPDESYISSIKSKSNGGLIGIISECSSFDNFLKEVYIINEHKIISTLSTNEDYVEKKDYCVLNNSFKKLNDEKLKLISVTDDLKNENQRLISKYDALDELLSKLLSKEDSLKKIIIEQNLKNIQLHDKIIFLENNINYLLDKKQSKLLKKSSNLDKIKMLFDDLK